MVDIHGSHICKAHLEQGRKRLSPLLVVVSPLAERTRRPIPSWLGYDSVLQQAEKEQSATARVATIEAESKFIEISIQMRGRNRSLVGTEQPAFEQRRHAMHSRHGNVCRIATA